jgi:hypothetical protein
MENRSERNAFEHVTGKRDVSYTVTSEEMRT